MWHLSYQSANWQTITITWLRQMTASRPFIIHTDFFE